MLRCPRHAGYVRDGMCSPTPSREEVLQAGRDSEHKSMVARVPSTRSSLVRCASGQGTIVPTALMGHLVHPWIF